jgi:hypothetical protein
MMANFNPMLALETCEGNFDSNNQIYSTQNIMQVPHSMVGVPNHNNNNNNNTNGNLQSVNNFNSYLQTQR